MFNDHQRLLPPGAFLLTSILVLSAVHAQAPPCFDPIERVLCQKGYLAIDLHRSKHGYLLANAKINNNNAVLVVDTGAPCCGISEQWAAGAGIQWTKITDPELVYSQANSFMLDHLDLGQIRLRKTDVEEFNRSIAQFGEHVDGVMGYLDVLKAYSAVIDFRACKLYMVNEPAQQSQTEVDQFWLEFQTIAHFIERIKQRRAARSSGPQDGERSACPSVREKPAHAPIIGNSASTNAKSITQRHDTEPNATRTSERNQLPSGNETNSSLDSLDRIVANSGYSAITIFNKHRRPAVEVAINNKPATFLLDTGAPDIHICKECADRIGLNLERGPVHEILVANAREVALGSIDLGAARLLCHNKCGSLDGLLGFDALIKHAPIIDCGNSRLYLHGKMPVRPTR